MINHWVAFSGGMDSHVLLHFLKNNFSDFNLKAIHINHQLLPEANSWEKHCRKICRELKIPLKIIRVNINKNHNIEAHAREARYTAFKKILKPKDILFTAHHLDDQAETFLFQLLRGAGLKGVSAMPKISGQIIRPLLKFSREDLLLYAKKFKLNYINDPSNLNIKFDRNYLRHEVFPILKKRWPHVHKTFARFAEHCAEQEKLLQILAKQDAQHFSSKLSVTRQKNALRYLIQQYNFDMPSEKILNEIIKMYHSRSDKSPIVKWRKFECRRYQNKLYFLKLGEKKTELTQEDLDWCKKHKINLKNKTIKYRQGGEKFKSKTLKNLFQEWKIPPWLRDQIPLVYDKNKLIAIVGYVSLNHRATSLAK